MKHVILYENFDINENFFKDNLKKKLDIELSSIKRIKNIEINSLPNTMDKYFINIYVEDEKGITFLLVYSNVFSTLKMTLTSISSSLNHKSASKYYSNLNIENINKSDTIDIIVEHIKNFLNKFLI